MTLASAQTFLLHVMAVALSSTKATFDPANWPSLPLGMLQFIGDDVGNHHLLGPRLHRRLHHPWE
jgi:hypothetical protein